jgi:hypothetical protein
MPTNYVDQVPFTNVHRDLPSGLEHGLVRSTCDPTSDNGTGVAFATVYNGTFKRVFARYRQRHRNTKK